MPWRQFARDLFREVQTDRVSNGAAALAYFLMLAIFPALIFLLSLLPYLPIPGLENDIMALLYELMPPEAADLFTGTVRAVVSQRSGGLLSFGFLGTLWAASAGLHSVMQQLNSTYNVAETRPLWKTRATSILLFLAFIVLVCGALVLVLLGGALLEYLTRVLGLGRFQVVLLAAFRWAVVLGGLLLAFAITYYVGPNIRQRFRILSAGSVVGTALLMLAAVGMRVWFEYFYSYNATYGSLAAVIVLLVSLYVSGLVILIGSEVDALFERYQAQHMR